MGNIGDPITPAIPPVGTAGPQYAVSLDAILTEIVSRLSTKVPLSSVSFNSPLNLNGSDISNVGNLIFANQVSSPSGSPFNRWVAFNGDIYWINAAGPVQLTTGGVINSASIGGITGSYGGAFPPQFRYDAGNTRYDAFANFSTGSWAYVRALGFDIAGNGTSSAFARLVWGGTSNITLTLPTVLPSANKILSLDNSGNITTGQSTILDANQSITISGTASYKHGVKTISESCKALLTNTTAGTASNTAGQAGMILGNNTIAFYPVPAVPQHARIVSVSLYFNSAADRNACTSVLFSTSNADPATRTFTTTGITLTPSGTAISSASNVNLQQTGSQQLWVQISNSVTTPVVVGIVVGYDIP